jgi:hypothetical protein
MALERSCKGEVVAKWVAEVAANIGVYLNFLTLTAKQNTSGYRLYEDGHEPHGRSM